MELTLIKKGDLLLPVTSDDRDKVESLKENQILHCEATKKRNVKFHRKFMSLVSAAYDMFEPPEVEIKGRMIAGTKDFDEFRKWLIVKAGYYDIIGYPDGGVRLRAKSIAFSNMDEEQFSKLFSNCIDVVIRYICVNFTEKELQDLVDRIMGYT